MVYHVSITHMNFRDVYCSFIHRKEEDFVRKNNRNKGLYHTVDITCTRTREEEKDAEILIKIEAKNY